MVFHEDRAELAAPVAATVYEGRVASVHTKSDPLVYKWGNEYRSADLLPLIAAQLPGKPVTLLHPADHYNHGGNAKSVGTIASARVDGDHVIASIVITDEVALRTIQSGVHDLSLGYDARCDEAGFQIEITVDHLALVPVGRCTSCELRADCGCEVEGNPSVVVAEVSAEAPADAPGPVVACTCLDKKQDTCQTSGMDELQKKLDEALALVTKAESDLLEATTARDAEKLRADKADEDKTKAEIDAQNARKDAEKAQSDVEKVRADALDAVAAAKVEAKAEAKVRTELEATANAVLGSADKDGVAVDRTALTDKEIKVAVIKHVDGDDLDETKPDLYIDGVFEGAVKRHRKGAAALAETRQVIETVRKDGVVATTELKPEHAADVALRNRYSNAWMNTSTKKDN